MSSLYNLQGVWSSVIPYKYLDAVTYGKYTYICTNYSGSVDQRPDQTPLVWVQMPVITQEDQYYLKSRELLLPYEDARYQSLINAMANFYTMRNDQSIWGSFLRAVSMELARIEYMYSYDIVAKNPQYLTPPDIKREYADPLFVTGNFQQLSQFDSGNFGGSFGQWVANTGVVFNTAIYDNNGNIQVATTAGETGRYTPSWSLIVGKTTIDGSVVWTNSGVAPTTLAYPIGYRDMLVDLLAAYQEGATAKSIQDVIYAYTGKNIVVEELYKEISDGFYDQSDRNSVKVSVNVGGSDPLVDINSLEELQQITNSLYGAIDLAKPAHVGLEFTTVFGSDENIDCFISSQFLSQKQLSTLSENQQIYYSLIAYIPNPCTWEPNTTYTLNDIIQDSNGYLQIATFPLTSPPITNGISGTTMPDWTTLFNMTTPDNQVIWVNIGSPIISWLASTNYAQGSLIQDTNGDTELAIVGGVSGVNKPNWDTNSTTDGQVTWVNITSSTQIWSDSTTYNTGDIVRSSKGVFYLAKAVSINQNPVTDNTYWLPLLSIVAPPISIGSYNNLPSSQKPYFQGYYQNLNCVGTGINDMLRIIIQQYEEPPFDPMLYQAPIFDVNNPTTTLASYGYHIFSPLSQTNWLTLQNTPQVWVNTSTYSKGTLVRGRPVSTPGNFNAGVWTPGGWQLYRALKKNGVGSAAGVQDPLTSSTYWAPLAGLSGQLAPSIYQAYYRSANGQYIAGSSLQQWAPNTSFYTGQYAIDPTGNLQIAVDTSSSLSPVTTMGVTSPIINVANINHAVVISNNVLTLMVDSRLESMGLVPGTSSVTILNFTYATFLNGLTLPVANLGTTSSPPVNTISMAFNHENYDSGLQSESAATVSVAFSTSVDVPTYDGTILWEYLGSNYINAPAKWIQVVNSTNTPTGEVANWDVNHQMGLLAPRLDNVWEIAGDTLNSYEME